MFPRQTAKRPTRLYISSLPLPTHKLPLRSTRSPLHNVSAATRSPILEGSSQFFFGVIGWDFLFFSLVDPIYAYVYAHRTLANPPMTSSVRTTTSTVPLSRSRPLPPRTSPSRSTVTVTQKRLTSLATSRASTPTRLTA